MVGFGYFLELPNRRDKIKTVCCNAYAISFIFARMFNDDLSPHQTTSVPASYTHSVLAPDINNNHQHLVLRSRGKQDFP